MIAEGYGCYSCSDSTNITSGSVSGTWTLEGGPYMVGGDIQVDSTATLTIEAGVNVLFTGHYKFTVYGQLLALGTEDMNIFFTAQDTTTGWGGLRFIDNNTNEFDPSRLAHCKIEYGNAQGNWPDNVGGGIFCQSSNTKIDTCIIVRNKAVAGAGLYASDSNPEIYYSLIAHNRAQEFGGGIALCEVCVAMIINCTICDNDVDETMYGGGGGIYSGSYCWSYLLNSIIWGNDPNQLYQVYRSRNDRDFTIMYCDIEGFTPDANGNIGSDPLFTCVGPDYYSLSENSPCIDAGYPSEQDLDPDGTRLDMGAFPYFQTPEPPVVAISIQNNQVSLACSGSSRSSYAVYSSGDPEGTFTVDETGSFNGDVWTAPLSGDKRFYYVKTVTGSRFDEQNVASLSEFIEIHKKKASH